MALRLASTSTRPVGACRPASAVLLRPSPTLAPRPRQLVARAGGAADLAAAALGALKNVDTDKLKAQAKDAAAMSASAVQACIQAGLSAWSTYDKDGDGKLSISEAVALLNSPEVAAAIKNATGLEHSQRTEADIQAWFARADFDHSGTLSKREFAAMYAGLLCEKAVGNASSLSNALLSALSATAGGADGKVGIGELKNLLGLVGLRNK